MGQHPLVDSFLQLCDVLLTAKVVDGWQAGVLHIQKGVLEDLLVVLGHIDGPEFAGPSPVVGLVPLIVD